MFASNTLKVVSKLRSTDSINAIAWACALRCAVPQTALASLTQRVCEQRMIKRSQQSDTMAPFSAGIFMFARRVLAAQSTARVLVAQTRKKVMEYVVENAMYHAMAVGPKGNVAAAGLLWVSALCALTRTYQQSCNFEGSGRGKWSRWCSVQRSGEISCSFVR